MPPKRYLLSLILGLVILVSGCETNPAAPTTSQLEAHVWLLTSMDNKKPIPGTTITLSVRADFVSGSGGANRYNAGWQYEAGKVSLSPIAATKRMMLEPVGAMDQEQAYFEMLQVVTKAVIVDKVLLLTTEDGRELKFAPQPAL